MFKYEAMVASVVRRYKLAYPDIDTDDMRSEIYLSVVRALNKARPDHGSYIYNTIELRARRYVKKIKLKRETFFEPKPIFLDTSRVEVDEFMEGLTPENKFILIKLLEGHTQTEIAEMLNVTPQAISLRVKRIRDLWLTNI